jgi:hypothetical protein
MSNKRIVWALLIATMLGIFTTVTPAQVARLVTLGSGGHVIRGNARSTTSTDSGHLHWARRSLTHLDVLPSHD